MGVERLSERGDGTMKDPEINLHSLQICKPNFFLLVESVGKNYELDMQNMKNRKINLSFLGNMRAILDSKYNEMLMLESTPK